MPLAAADPAPATSAPVPVPLRVIHAGGPLDRDEVVEHLEFSANAGWNAVWLPVDASTPEPTLDRFLGWCRARGVRPILAVAPLADAGGAYRYGDAEARERLLARLRSFAARGVRDVALDLQLAPRRLSDLSDALEYGVDALAAQADLAADAAAALDESVTVWLAPAIFSDLGAGGDLVGALAPLAGLSPRVGLVWAGPRPVAATIVTADVARVRAAIGERPLLLQDRFPHNFAGARLPTAVPLGPLRGREAGVARAVDGWLTLPSHPLATARLSLLTIAAYLTDPAGYDPEAALEAAVRRLAGRDEEVRDALRTQTIEWGGFIGERNYRSALTENPAAAAAALRDPAATALWVWTVRRYPGRMTAIAGAADRTFAAALLDIMARRLAIARALPTVRDLRAARGEREAVLLERLRHELARADEAGGARTALRRFLEAADVAAELDARPAGAVVP